MHEGRLTEIIMPRKNKAVLQAEKIANQLHSELYGNTSEEAPKKPEVKREMVTNIVAQPSETETQQQEVEQPEVAQAQPEQVEESTTPVAEPNFEQKYKVLEGKYNAEVPRMAQENRSLKEELESLRSEVTNLKTLTAKPKEEVKPLVSQEDRDQFGDDLIEVMKKASREVMSESLGSNTEVDTLKQELNTIKKQQSNSQELTFYNELNTLFPSWRQGNEDAGFLTWLNEVDKYSGQTRQQLLSQAESNRDARRVATFFIDYFGQQQSEPSTSKPSLEEQVSPKPSGKTNVPPAKKFYSNRELAQFYNAVRNGKINKAEAERIERDIFKAQSEGRIRAD